MANYREFSLYNYDRSSSIDLNSINGYLATMPTGLGIYFANTYFAIGNKRILTSQKNRYEPLTMIIDIVGTTRDDVELKYANIRNFIAKNRSMGFILTYLPFQGGTMRFLECDIKTIDKGEKSTSRYMRVSLAIEPRGLWKVGTESEARIAGENTGRGFTFAEDSGISGVTVYNPYLRNQYGEGTVNILGYSGVVFPDGISLDVTVGGMTFKIVREDFEITDDGTKLEANIDTGFWGDDSLIHIVFDTVEGVVTCGLFQPAGEEVEYIEDQDYIVTEDKILAGGEYSDFFEFLNQDAIDNVCVITLRSTIFPRPTRSIYKKRGSTSIKIRRSEVEEIVSVTRGIISIGEEVSDIPFDLDGIISVGTSNNVAIYEKDDDVSLEIGSNFYAISFFSAGSVYNDIENDGDESIPAIIRISGPAVNPVVTLCKKGESNAIQSTKINITIPAGTHIEINSDPENVGVWVFNDTTGEKTNIIEAVDAETNMFITVPKGDYTVRVVDENNNVCMTKVLYNREYWGA